MKRRRGELGQVAPAGFGRPWGTTYIGVLLAIVLLIFGILMAADSFTATPSHIGWLFVLAALAILL